MYFHLDDILAEKSQRFEKGRIIGTLGTDGTCYRSAAAQGCPDKQARVNRCPVDLVETGKIEISALHDVLDGPKLDEQLVEDVDIVDFSRSDDHDGRNISMQIQKSMEFDRPLAFPELGPREKSQTEVDSRRIQGVNRLIQFDAKGIGGVKLSGFLDEDLSEVCINPPISGLIGMSKGIAGDLPPDAQMVKSGLGCPQADLDISQAFAISKLGECHAEKLVPARETDHFAIAVVLIDAFSELVCGDEIH